MKHRYEGRGWRARSSWRHTKGSVTPTRRDTGTTARSPARISHRRGSLHRPGRQDLLGDQHLDPDDWLFLIIPTEHGLYRVHVPAAVALARTSPEDRDRIRAALPGYATHVSNGVMNLVNALNVSKHAVVHVARIPEPELRAVKDLRIQSWAGEDIRRLRPGRRLGGASLGNCTGPASARVRRALSSGLNQGIARAGPRP